MAQGKLGHSPLVTFFLMLTNTRTVRLFLVPLIGFSAMWNSSLAEDNQVFTQQALMQDARQLASILEQSHPDPYIGAGGKVAFQRKFQNLVEDIPATGMTTEQYYRLLLPFVASLRDGHTALLPPQSGTPQQPGLPLSFKIIDESLVVDGVVHKDYSDLRGALLLAVEGVSLPELLRRQNNLRGIENVYGTLALLTRSLGTEKGLHSLIPERANRENIHVTLRLAGGETRDFPFNVGENTETVLEKPTSRVRMPDMSHSDVAWSFLDKSGKTALLKIDDMSTYREACEAWLAAGMTEGLEMARAAYRKFNEQAAPEKVEDILLGIPSATDVFKELVVAMEREGTTLLIVDLRENTGGNDLMVQMLLYFLFGQEAMTTYDAGFQISRYSDLYFQVYANESLSNINQNRVVPLEIGDYDFSQERAKENEIDPVTSKREYEESLKKSPTFYEVFSQDIYANHYHPPKLAVLSSAWTYSSGFTMLAALEGLGATVVGTPSAHAGNNFGDSLLFQLANTQLRGAVSFKQNVTFPDDPVKGHCLRPDIMLTNEKWAALGYDPNAEVLLAIEPSEQKAKDKGGESGSCPATR
jgi:hypothetical protein